MSGAPSRRGMILSLSTLPLGAGVAMAATTSLEADFLAIASVVLPLLKEYDAHWALTHEPYEEWVLASARLKRSVRWIKTRDEQARRDLERDLPEWIAYIEARRPADEIDDVLEYLVADYMDVPATSLPCLLLKHRIGKTLEHFADDVTSDLDKMLEAAPWA